MITALRFMPNVDDTDDSTCGNRQIVILSGRRITAGDVSGVNSKNIITLTADNRFGDVYREGWYVLDEFISNVLTIQKDKDLNFLHTQLTELHIGDNTLNSIPSLPLEQLKYLKILSVGDYCLQKIDSFIIASLSELEQITIGSFCCIGKLPNRGNFSLSLLPSLISVRIGVGSFRYYRYLMVKSRS